MHPPRRGPTAALAALVLLSPIGPVAAGEPRIEVGKDRIDFKIGKDLVTSYAIAPAVAKPYFFPVRAPGGLLVTRPWPMEKDARGEATDHVHQKSLWFCHGDVIPEGLELEQRIKGVAGVDFWSEHKGHGVIACTRVEEPTAGKGRASVVTHNEWRTAEGKKVLDEKRTITLHDLGTGHLLTLDIDLHASAYPITFGDTKEGSLGVRVRETVRGDRKGVLTNADGKTGEGKAGNVLKDGCWGLKSAWCDYSGPTDGGATGGIAVLVDPSNPGPTFWHARNYGLMAANPFGRKKAGFPDPAASGDLVKLARGEHLKLRYGIYLHAGDVKEGKVADAFARFVKLRAAD